MRVILLFTFFILLTVNVRAEKVSFEHARLYLNIPGNFEKVHDGITPETLIRLRMKGKAPKPQCSVGFMRDTNFQGLTTYQIEEFINQLDGSEFLSVMSQSSPVFKNAKLIGYNHTYWSGFKALRVQFSVDTKYLGGSNYGDSFMDMYFTATNLGLYGLTCGHTKSTEAKGALEILHQNVLIR